MWFFHLGFRQDVRAMTGRVFGDEVELNLPGAFRRNQEIIRDGSWSCLTTVGRLDRSKHFWCAPSVWFLDVYDLYMNKCIYIYEQHGVSYLEPIFALCICWMLCQASWPWKEHLKATATPEAFAPKRLVAAERAETQELAFQTTATGLRWLSVTKNIPFTKQTHKYRTIQTS